MEMGNSADKPELEALDSITLPSGLVVIPTDVTTLWRKYGEVRLFHDLTHGQWGVTLWPRTGAFGQTMMLRDLHPDLFRADDLILGDFRGDTDLFVVPTDQAASDWGHVLVANPLDDRIDWYDAAPTLSQFLARLADNNGEKYWTRQRSDTA
jgi:hypothetical protein